MARPKIYSDEELKEQKRVYQKEYQIKNRERISTSIKEYRKQNKEKVEAREALYRENNREVLRHRSNEWYHKDSRELISNNPKKLMLRRTRNSAKGRGYECSITEDDFYIPEYCPVLGYKLEFKKGDKENDSPSMDRKDSSLGYIPGNVQVISYRANKIKSDMTKEELEKLYNFIFNPK